MGFRTSRLRKSVVFCQILESRPFFRELEDLAGRMRQAPAAEQEALLSERQRRTKELQARFPT